MATIGQTLTAPESGWRRYNDSDSRIIYDDFTNARASQTGAYNSDLSYSTSTDGKITFKFKGTKLRIISQGSANRADNHSISIDGNAVNYTEKLSSTTNMVLVYEKIGLTDSIHEVIITSGSNGTYPISLDAIDIDDTGYLVHPILNQISDINTMEEGDCIPCRYTASVSGQPGYFSELGTCIADEIPITGTATPNGLFYFIKTAKGTLLADRVIQTNISWNTLNAAKYIEGGILNRIGLTLEKLTSNIGSSFSVEASSVTTTSSISYEPYKMFDNDSTVTSTWKPLSKANEFVILTFQTPKKVNMYELQTLNGSNTNTFAPRSWVFEGSNDKTNWNILDTRTVTNWSTAMERRAFEFTNDNLYKYYRLYISTNNGGSVIYLSEMDLYEILETSFIIRSMSGGCAYADVNSNMSLTNQNYGGWPTVNEWDKYIVNSDLKGKITKGDDNIWHSNNVPNNWCKETPINGLIRVSDGASASNANRCYRKVSAGEKMSYTVSSNAFANTGFRPVLNYIESDIASEVIY